jgi:hypothetical protein
MGSWKFMEATHHTIYQTDVAWTLSVDADDLGIKASGVEGQRRTTRAPP